MFVKKKIGNGKNKKIVKRKKKVIFFFSCSDFGYQQGEEEGECVETPGVSTVPEYCPVGTTYNKTDGYRKVAGNTCVGGVTHTSVVTNCPSTPKPPTPKEPISMTLILMFVFFGVIILVIFLIIATKNKTLREKLFPCISFPDWWTGDRQTKFTLNDDIFDDDNENLLSGSDNKEEREIQVKKLDEYSANINNILDDKKGDDDL